MEKITKNVQLILLIIILISTIIAVGIEIFTMVENKNVTLADLLLMFLYLEVLAMVRVFWDQQSISITLPLLIAITALARFIILQGKEMDPSALVYEAVAIVLIASAIVILRLRHSDKLGLKKSHAASPPAATRMPRASPRRSHRGAQQRPPHPALTT